MDAWSQFHSDGAGESARMQSETRRSSRNRRHRLRCPHEHGDAAMNAPPTGGHDFRRGFAGRINVVPAQWIGFAKGMIAAVIFVTLVAGHDDYGAIVLMHAEPSTWAVPRILVVAVSNGASYERRTRGWAAR